MKKILILASLLFLLTQLSLSQIPVPPVAFGGPVGPGGPFPAFNSGKIVMPSDGDYTMKYPDMSAVVIRVTSAVPLTQTRNIIGPTYSGWIFLFTIKNETIGGQDIIFKTTSGVESGALIPYNEAREVMLDGNNNYAVVGSPVNFGAHVAWGKGMKVDTSPPWENTLSDNFGSGTSTVVQFNNPSVILAGEVANYPWGADNGSGNNQPIAQNGLYIASNYVAQTTIAGGVGYGTGQWTDSSTDASSTTPMSIWGNVGNAADYSNAGSTVTNPNVEGSLGQAFHWGSANVNWLIGTDSTVEQGGTGTVANMIGINDVIYKAPGSGDIVDSPNSGLEGINIAFNRISGNVPRMWGVWQGMNVGDNTTTPPTIGTIGTYYANYVSVPGLLTTGSTIGHQYVFVSEPGAGSMGINTITPTHDLEVNGTTQTTNLIVTGTCTGCGLAGPGGPPSGTAGGDLSGTYPSPTVTGIRGAAVPTPASGYLHYNGTAFLWDTPPGGTPGGATTQVQFNNAGAFGGSPNFVWNNTTPNLAITASGTSAPLTLNGQTSGSFTITPNAAAMTSVALGGTNLTQVGMPSGTSTVPGILFSGLANTGFSQFSSGIESLISGIDYFYVTNAGIRANNGPFQAQAFGTNLIYEGGESQTNQSTVGGSGTFRGATCVSGTGTGCVGGAATLQGGDNANTGATEGGGDITIRPGQVTGTGPTTFNNGRLFVSVAGVKGATATVGNAGCVSATAPSVGKPPTYSACTTTTNVPYLGPIQAANGSSITIQVAGDAVFNSTSASWVAGQFICLDTANAGLYTASSTPCAAGQGAGIVTFTDTSQTTHYGVIRTGLGSASASGLGDPGANGIIKRTALNTTAIAVAADYPTLNQSTTGNAATATALASNGTANQRWGMDTTGTTQGWVTPTPATPTYPMTIAGTVNSGGIPYASSATTEAYSNTLTAGGVVLGGGAGTAPFTDPGLSYSNILGQLSIGTVTSSTPGSILLNGATSGSVSMTPSNTANTLTLGGSAYTTLLLPNGSVPAVSIGNALNTGIFFGAGTVRAAAGGVAALTLTGTSIQCPNNCNWSGDSPGRNETFQSGFDTAGSGTVTGIATFRSGAILASSTSGSGSGNVILQSGDSNANGGAAQSIGNVTVTSGGFINTVGATAAWVPGYTIIQQKYWAETSPVPTVGTLACYTTPGTAGQMPKVGTCTVTSNVPWIGIIAGAVQGQAISVVKMGHATSVASNTAVADTAGSFVCVDTTNAGKVVIQATTCPTGQGVGIIDQTGSGTTAHSVDVGRY